MRLNGNLVLNAGGLSEIQNAVVERVSSLPSFSSAEKGRFVFLTTEGKIYFNDGVQWSAIATGGNAATLQTEVDTLEAALGSLITTTGSFDAAGVVLANVTGATTLTSVIAQLDAALTAAQAATAAEASRATAAEATLTSALSAEVTRATGAEGTLTTNLAAEVTRATGAEGTLTTNLATETAARIAGDATLTTALSDEVARATSSEGVLTTDLAAEVTRATDAEAALQAAIDAEAAIRATADADETAARIAADTAAGAASGDQLATEQAARLAGDAAANVRIDGVQAELDVSQLAAGLNVDGTFTAPANTTYLGAATSLKDASKLLDTALTAEVARAVGVETNLGSAIANEAQLREDGDANLQTQLTAWVTTQLDGNAASDAAEVAARIAGDAGLQTELDQTQASIGLATDGTVIPVTGTNYLNGITSVFGGAFVLDTQIKTVADAVASESTARAATDATFQSNLDTERDTRIASDLALQTELNTVEVGAGLETDGSYASATGSNYIDAAISLKDADYILDAAIKVQADAIAALGTTSDSAVAAETAARIAADTAISSSLTTEVSRAQAAESAIAANLATEVTRATAAEGVLTTNLAAEVTRATAAEGVLTTNLAAEVTRAVDAEAALQDNVDTLHDQVYHQYFLYDGASSTSHSVVHALGQKYANVTVVDASNDEVIIPQSIVFVDANTLTVTLNSALAIKVVVSASQWWMGNV